MTLTILNRANTKLKTLMAATTLGLSMTALSMTVLSMSVVTTNLYADAYKPEQKTQTMNSLTTSSSEVDQVQSMKNRLLNIQRQWAIVNYRTEGDSKEGAFEGLIRQVDQLAGDFPKRAEPKVWQGIIRSTYAGAVGGLSALSYVKDARDYLITAMSIDETVLEGSVYTSLASLYAKVPGWPIGFGDSDKARQMFQQALTINPNGLDPNYFYGEFLFEEGEYQLAIEALNKALTAPKRNERPIADEERRKEIKHLLGRVKQAI